MEAGCCGRGHTDEAMDGGPSGAVGDAVREPWCPSKLEMQGGCTAAVPSLFEEPRWLSRGQEEASKLRGEQKTRSLTFTPTCHYFKPDFVVFIRTAFLDLTAPPHREAGL